MKMDPKQQQTVRFEVQYKVDEQPYEYEIEFQDFQKCNQFEFLQLSVSFDITSKTHILGERFKIYIFRKSP